MAPALCRLSLECTKATSARGCGAGAQDTQNHIPILPINFLFRALRLMVIRPDHCLSPVIAQRLQDPQAHPLGSWGWVHTLWSPQHIQTGLGIALWVSSQHLRFLPLGPLLSLPPLSLLCSPRLTCLPLSRSRFCHFMRHKSSDYSGIRGGRMLSFCNFTKWGWARTFKWQ